MSRVDKRRKSVELAVTALCVSDVTGYEYYFEYHYGTTCVCPSCDNTF